VQPSAPPGPRTERTRARRARRRVLHGFGVAAAGVALAVSTAVTISVFTLHLGIRPVLTGSMRPDYGPGAVLVTRQVPVTTLRPGMIVLFVPPGEHAEFAHRITSVTGPADAPVITTKGDANKVADPWHAKLTSPDVSEVIGSVPGLGRPLVDLRGAGQIVAALAGGLIAAWAATRWALKSSRTPDRRATVGGA
jgi:signal peptidase I